MSIDPYLYKSSFLVLCIVSHNPKSEVLPVPRSSKRLRGTDTEKTKEQPLRDKVRKKTSLLDEQR